MPSMCERLVGRWWPVGYNVTMGEGHFTHPLVDMLLGAVEDAGLPVQP